MPKNPMAFVPLLCKLLQRRSPKPSRHCSISTNRASCFPQQKPAGIWCNHRRYQPLQDSPHPNQPRHKRAEPDSPPPAAGQGDLGRTYRSTRPRLLIFHLQTQDIRGEMFAGGQGLAAPLPGVAVAPSSRCHMRVLVAIRARPVLIWRLFIHSLQ